MNIITFTNCQHIVNRKIEFPIKYRLQIGKHNSKGYSLDNSFNGLPTGFKPLHKNIGTTNCKARSFGNFSDKTLLKHTSKGSQRRLARLIISLPENLIVKFIGYDNNCCTIYKTEINGITNYHYNYKNMSTDNLPIDYYSVNIDSKVYQSITPRNLVKFITNIIKYQ